MTLALRFNLWKGGFHLDVDLSLPGRGVSAVFGPSGSGKTTLLRAVAGLDRPPDGHLQVGELTWQDGATFVPPHRRPIGYVFQEASLFPHLTVRGNVEYGRRRVPPGERRVSLEQAIHLLGIEPLLDRKPGDLSGGERQRVAMARALAVSPRLLLMDEPLASLDQERRKEVLPYLDSLHEELEIPVLYVSHALDEVARLADHLVLLDAGRVEASGAVGDLLTRLDLSLAKGADAESLIEATVQGHEDTWHLTRLETAAGCFLVAGTDLPVGRAVRLRIAARDVSLALTPPRDSSILNLFPAVIEEVSGEKDAQVTVRLRVGKAPLLSRITRKSAHALNLRPGQPVHAQVKSVALLV